MRHRPDALFSQFIDIFLARLLGAAGPGGTDHGVVSHARLSICPILCDFEGVNYQIAITRLLAAVMIAGLVWAPISHPVMAGLSSPVSTQAVTDEMSSSAIAEGMAGDMPCCPSKAPVDCEKCVLLATCMVKCFTGIAAIDVHPFLSASVGIALRRNDSTPDGLGHSPPEHPPRTLV